MDYLTPDIDTGQTLFADLSPHLEFSYNPLQIRDLERLRSISPTSIARGVVDDQSKHPITHWRKGSIKQKPAYAYMPPITKKTLGDHVNKPHTNNHAHGIPADFGLIGFDFDYCKRDATDEERAEAAAKFAAAVAHLETKGKVWAMPGGKGGHALMRVKADRDDILREFPKGCSTAGQDPHVRGTGYACEIKLLNTLRIADPSVWLEAAIDTAEPSEWRSLVEWKREPPKSERQSHFEGETHRIEDIRRAYPDLRPEGKDTLRGPCPKHDGDNPTAFVVSIGSNGKAMAYCNTRCGALSGEDYKEFIERVYPAPKRESKPKSGATNPKKPIPPPDPADFAPGGPRFKQKRVDYFVTQRCDYPETIEAASDLMETYRSKIEETNAKLEGLIGMMAGMVGKDKAKAMAESSLLKSEIECLEDELDAVYAAYLAFGGKYEDDRPVHPLILAHRLDILRPFTEMADRVEYSTCRDRCKGVVIKWWWDEHCTDGGPKRSLADVGLDAARDIGGNFDIPEKDVDSVMRTLSDILIAAGGHPDPIVKAGKDYRDHSRIKPTPNGSAPEALSKTNGKGYDVKGKSMEFVGYMLEEMQRDVRPAGGAISPRLLKPDTTGDLAYILRRTNARTIHNFVDSRYEMTIPGMSGWGEGKDSYITYSQLDRLTRLISLASHNLLTAHDISRSTKIDARSLGGQYAIAPALIGWARNEKAIFALLSALKGTEIPVVDVMSDWTKSIIAKHKAASPEYLGQCLNTAKRLLLDIDGCQPVKGQEDLAIEAGQIIYATLMTRRLEAMEAVERGTSPVETQRYVPTLLGEKGVGKTTIGKLIVPTEEHLKPALGEIRKDVLKASGGIFERRVNPLFSFSTDVNDSIRQMVGKVVVVNDEMKGLSSAMSESSKSIITLTQGEFHRKYENYKEFRRSDVMLINGNKASQIPNDPAIQDRTVALEMEKRYPEESDSATGMRISRWMCERYEMLFVGGLEMAYQMRKGNLVMEPTISQALRAHVIETADDEIRPITIQILDLIIDGVFSWRDVRGVKWLSFERVCQHVELGTSIKGLYFAEDVHVEPDRNDGLTVKNNPRIDKSNRLHEQIRRDAGLALFPGHSDDTNRANDVIKLGDEFSPWVRAAVKAQRGRKGTPPKGAFSPGHEIAEAMRSLVSKKSYEPRKHIPDTVARRWLNGAAEWPWATNQIGDGPRCLAIRLDDPKLIERLARRSAETVDDDWG